jgi:hypothetical protein
VLPEAPAGSKQVLRQSSISLNVRIYLPGEWYAGFEEQKICHPFTSPETKFRLMQRLMLTIQPKTKT